MKFNWSPGDLGHSTEHNAITVRLIDVKDYGAVGNGTTDDTVAIQAAIDARKTLRFSSGTYKISSTLTLQAGSQLYLASDCTIKPASNIDVFRMKAGAFVSGGIINCSGVSWDSTIFYFNGTDQFNLTAPTIIENVRMLNDGLGTAIKMLAAQDGIKNHYVFGTRVSNCTLNGFTTGVLLKNVETEEGTWARVNANRFYNIITINVVNSLVMEGAGVEGNIIDFVVQIWAGFNSALDCEGVRNVIRFFVWDWVIVTYPTAFLFSATTTENDFITNLKFESVEDLGTRNNLVSTYTQAFGNIVLTPDGTKRYRLGVDNDGIVTASLLP